MLRFLFTIMKKAPLLCAIFLVWVILTILALTGRGRGYRKYNEDFGRHPLVSVVMRGIHDHVMPWSDSPPEEETSGTLLVDSGTQAQTPAASPVAVHQLAGGRSNFVPAIADTVPL